MTSDERLNSAHVDAHERRWNVQYLVRVGPCGLELAYLHRVNPGLENTPTRARACSKLQQQPEGL
jgi:hypothetical protein